MKEKIKNLLAKIGMEPSPFIMGWLSATIGFILGIALMKIIF